MHLQRVSPNSSRTTQKKQLSSVILVVPISALILISSACNVLGIGQSSNSSIQVAVTPANVSVTPGATQQFTATVHGTSNSAIGWSASAGSITSDGIFTAPALSEGAQVSITAVSLADVTQRGTAVATLALSQKLHISTASALAVTSNTPAALNLAADGGTPPYRWSISSGTLPSGLSLDTAGAITGTTSQIGQYSFSAKVTDGASSSVTQSFAMTVSAVSNSAFDGPAELPRVYLQTAAVNTPSSGSTITVNAGGDLQGALDSANCGDTINIQAGATFTGSYTLPAKSCDSQHWITVRTSAADSSLPPEGTRMTPCYAGVSSLAGRPSFNCTSPSKVLATISYSGVGDGPIGFASGANHYRLLGLEITRVDKNGKAVGSLISAPQGGSMDSIVVDRCYVHGVSIEETRRGVRLAGATNAAVQDSYLSDFHCNAAGTCSDAQAVSGGTGDLPMGPYKITNNFLEASGENILFGGGEATQTPSDIEVSHNHFFKPWIWKVGQPGFLVETVVKNHFELKNAKRVLLDSNVMENSWGGYSQYGFSVMLTPKNQDLNGASVCPLCQVTDVTVRYTTISHVGGAITIANIMTPEGGLPLAGERFSIHDIIADDIQDAAYAGHGTFAQVSSIAQPLLGYVQINHVTAFENHTMFNVGAPNTVQIPGFSFTNSIVMAGETPIWSTGAGGNTNCAYYDVPVTTVSRCFSGYVFDHNAILESPYASSSWPSGNSFYSTTGIGFVNYNNGNGGDYHLLSSSPAIGAANDGTNLGANVDAVLTAIAGVQ